MLTKKLTGQLWNYMTTCFDETAQRRESDTKDFRSAIVCLASACIRVARFVDMVKVNTLGLDAGTGFTNAYTSSISFDAAAGLVVSNQNVIKAESTHFASRLTEGSVKKNIY